MSGDELRRMQELVVELWRLQGPAAGQTIGGLAWAVSLRPDTEISIWEHDGTTAAWAWLEGPGELQAAVHPDRVEIAPEVAAWADERCPGAASAWLAPAQEPLREELARRGFREVRDGPWTAILLRDLDGLPAAVPPAGFRLRAVELPRDLEERVRVHRAAWKGSRVSVTGYEALARTWPYRPDLDRVVETADGLLAACTNAWIDEWNGVGELEPVGTDVAFRRRGLARAVCLDALAALAAAGASRCVILARGDEGYPVPRRLYESIGFACAARIVTLAR